MTTSGKQDQNVLKRCERTIARIDKELENLRIARDKKWFESPEYQIISNAMSNLEEAKSHLNIAVGRIINKQKGIY